MALWALASHNACETHGDLVGSIMQAVRLDEVAPLSRGPEALANTARAVASSAGDGAFFRSLAQASALARPRFSRAEFSLLCRCFAVAKARGVPVDLPFGDCAPADASAAAHAALSRFGEPVDKVEWLRSCDNFLTRAEAEEILTFATWQRSLAYADSEAARTSETASLAGTNIAVVRELQRRAAEIFGFDASCCESLQLVRYTEPGHYYVEHFDLLDDHDQLLIGGQRIGTVLVYLSDLPPDAGGHTFFPHPDVAVIPKFGTAVAWANVTPLGDPDLKTKHAALPLSATAAGEQPEVLSGGRQQRRLEKIAINCWIRAFPGADSL